MKLGTNGSLWRKLLLLLLLWESLLSRSTSTGVVENVLERVIQQHYIFPRHRKTASDVQLTLCNISSHEWRNLNFGNGLEHVWIVGAVLHRLDDQSNILGAEMMLITQNKNQPTNPLTSFRLKGSLFHEDETLLYTEDCSLLESRNEAGLASAVYACDFVTTEQAKGIFKNDKECHVLSSMCNTVVRFVVEDPLQDLRHTIPLCHNSAHTGLSHHVFSLPHENRDRALLNRFYHTLIGCTRVLQNVDKLERNWPGVINQWVIHNIFMMNVGYLNVYDIDGSAFPYVKDFVKVGLIRYYGNFTWSNMVHDNDHQDDLVSNNAALNFMADNHCIWDSKGKSEWTILLRSPLHFINDYFIGGRKLYQHLDNISLTEYHTKLEVIQHSVRWLSTNPQACLSTNTSSVIFTSFPFVHMITPSTHQMLIVDPNVLSSIKDANMEVFTVSQYGLLEIYVREYSSLMLNVTTQPHTIGTTNALIVDNTMDKIFSISPWARDIQAKLLAKANVQDTVILSPPDSVMDNRINVVREDVESVRLVIIAPGLLEIPPKGYGAVESIVWNYLQTLPNHGFEANVVNSQSATQVIDTIKYKTPDIVHIQIESWAYLADRISNMVKLVLVTIHSPQFTDPSKWDENLAIHFNAVTIACRARSNIYFLIINEKHRDVLTIRWNVPSDRIYHVPNGVENEEFRFLRNPIRKDRSVNVGTVIKRKGQYFLQSFMPPGEISFIGPHGNCQQFDFSDPNYLGPWTKQQLHQTLTEFGNLVHLATDEGAPLVVLEALAAGLGVVTTVNASANLDITKPFITVIPEEKIYDTEYILAAIRKNREVSLTMREEIREYARQTFSWKEVIVPQYASLVRKLLSEQESYGLSSQSASWASKYALTNVDNSKHRVTGVPYIGVVSLLHSVSGSIIEWIDTLRVLGVDYFLFYTVHSNDDKMLPLLKDYITKGVVEVQYVTDFAYYDSLDDTGKMNIFDDKYFHILCLNEAVAYFRLVGITWHIVLYEQDYLYENGKYSGMVRNAVKQYLKQQEQRNVDITVIHGSVELKLW